jgi:hypothetical protein
MYIGPNNDDSWGYVVSENNSAGMYFNTNQGNFQFDTGSLGSYTNGEVDVGYASHEFRCGLFSNTVTSSILCATSNITTGNSGTIYVSNNATNSICTCGGICLKSDWVRVAGGGGIYFSSYSAGVHSGNTGVVCAYNNGVFCSNAASGYGIRSQGCILANVYLCANTCVRSAVICGATCVVTPVVCANRINANCWIGCNSIAITCSAWVTGATVCLNAHEGGFLRVVIAGDWNSHSAIGYMAEFFIQDGVNGYSQPGSVIREVTNQHNSDYITARICDPGAASTPRQYLIQFQTVVPGSNTTASGVAYYDFTGRAQGVS